MHHFDNYRMLTTYNRFNCILICQHGIKINKSTKLILPTKLKSISSVRDCIQPSPPVVVNVCLWFTCLYRSCNPSASVPIRSSHFDVGYFCYYLMHQLVSNTFYRFLLVRFVSFFRSNPRNEEWSAFHRSRSYCQHETCKKVKKVT